MSYRLEDVERIPTDLEDGVVYVSEEYEIAALKCACGCGHKVTLLLGDGHQVRELNGGADISPSIGVWDAPCRSHFCIKRGELVWAAEMSENAIRASMENQLQRHIQMTRQPWYRRWWASLIGLFR